MGPLIWISGIQRSPEKARGSQRLQILLMNENELAAEIERAMAMSTGSLHHEFNTERELKDRDNGDSDGGSTEDNNNQDANKDL